MDGRVDEPKDDPGNTLRRQEIKDKFRRLAAYAGAVDAVEGEAMRAKACAIGGNASLGSLYGQWDVAIYPAWIGRNATLPPA